jgi:hypothetical protein
MEARSFASETVFPVLSLCDPLIELYTEWRCQKARILSAHPYPIHTSSSPRTALPSLASGSSKETPMVCGDALLWSLSPSVMGGCPSPRLKVDT